MGDMLKSLKQFVEIAKGDETRLNWFANQFATIIIRRLEHEGKTLTSRLGVLHEALDIFSNVRPTLPNNENVEKLTKLLFVDCVRIILSDGYRELEKTGTSIQLNSFKSVIHKAVTRLSQTGYSHRFELLQFVLKHHWSHPVLQQLMLNLPCDHEVAMAYIERGETTEMFHIRVQLLLQLGYQDLALNLCTWCVKSRRYWYDSYLRAVQLHVLHSKGQLDEFTKQCQQLTCCMGLEIARKMKIDSELYLSLLQTILVQDWLRPTRHCCTKELLDLWLEARYQVEETEQGFLNSVSGLVHRHCSTWQLMSLVDVMHNKFGKQFMQFYLEVCLKVLRKDKSYLEEARALRKQKVIESQRGSLTYVCTLINCVSVNWSWKLRRLSMLCAMSLEPSDEFVDIIESLYETTEERHDCHLVENTDNSQADMRGRSYRRKKLTKFELRAATMCSKDGYVFIPESSDLKHQGVNKTVRRRMLNGENSESQGALDGSGLAQNQEQIKEEPSTNPNCMCHISDKCPCEKSPAVNTAVLSGHIVCQNTCYQSDQPSVSAQQLLEKYFVVRDVLPKTSQDLIDLLTELRCPELGPDQPYEDLYHKCEAHLHPPPHRCLYEVFDGGMSQVGSDAEESVELFEIRPGATKWIFDGEDLDAPEPKLGRGRPRKKVIYEEIEDQMSDSDTDRADSQYSGSTVVNSPMSASTDTAEEFDIHFNEDSNTTDSQDLEAKKRAELQQVASMLDPSLKSSQVSRGLLHEVQKDSVKRETMFRNFDRIRDKIKQGKTTGDVQKEITRPVQRSLPSSFGDQSQRSKAILSEYMKEQRRLEHIAKETVSNSQVRSTYSMKGFHDYSLAHKHDRLQKSGIVKSLPKDNSKLATWDATLRQGLDPSVEASKDYRIPKKSTYNPTAMSNQKIISQNRNHANMISHPSGVVSVSIPGQNKPASGISHSHQQQPGMYGNKSVTHATPQSTVSTAQTLQPHLTIQQTPVVSMSAVQQLASRPPNKSMVSPVATNSTQHPLTSVTGNQVGAHNRLSQVPLKANVQQKAFLQYTQAATYHQNRPHSSTQATHTATVHPQTHTTSQMQPATEKSAYLHSINRLLPPNVTVQSVQTQMKLPSTPPTQEKTTVVPLSMTQMKAAQSVVGQEATTQSTVYLGSFVSDPEKPWPCLSVPEVISNLDPPQTQSIGQVGMKSDPRVQVPSTIYHAPTTISVQYNTLNNHNSGDTPKGHSSTQKLPKEVDSDIEIYLTHKSPVVPSKGNQQEVVVVPRIKEQDIEVEQMNILSNLRRKIGGGEQSKPVTNQIKPKPESSRNGGPEGKKIGFDSLPSQIGQIIQNVIRSDQNRQRDMKSNSTSSSHVNVRKEPVNVVRDTSIFASSIIRAGNGTVFKTNCDRSTAKTPTESKTVASTASLTEEIFLKQTTQSKTREKSDKHTDHAKALGSVKDTVVSRKLDEDGADSDDSSDSLPRDGSFKMMALSPKSSSVKVLEGTNVNDLLESLQDSSGTVPQEVVRAAHLKLNKDESIEDVLLKMENIGSASATDKSSKATPGTKRTEKVAWGCSFKQGVYSVEVSKDRARKQKFRTKKISKEDLENEPISEMANKEGVKVFVIQVKKSGNKSGSGRSTPALGNSPPEEEPQGPEDSMESGKKVTVDNNDAKMPVKPAIVHSERPSQGKETVEIVRGAVEHSIPGDRKQVVDVANGMKNGESHVDSSRPGLIKPSVGNSGKDQQIKGPSASPEQLVTVRPQFGRLIPELSPLSQRVKTAQVTLAGPATGTVKAVFTVAGASASPDLTPTEIVLAQTADKKSNKPEPVVSVALTSADLRPACSNAIKVTYSNYTKTTVSTVKSVIVSDTESVKTAVVNSVPTSYTTTSGTKIPMQNDNPVPTSLSSRLPADVKVTKVVMHPNNTNIAKVLEVPARAIENSASGTSSQSTTGRGVLISHTVVEWADVVSYMPKYNNYLCKICQKKYGTEKMMGLHVSRTHSQVLHVQDGFLCPLCKEDYEEKFPTFDEIKAHMEVKHRRAVGQENPKPALKSSQTEPQKAETYVKTSAEETVRPETPSSENSSAPAKLKPVDTSSDEEISFKITAEERERVLGPEEWPPSPVVNTGEHSEEDPEQQEKQVAKRGRARKSTAASSDSSSAKRMSRRKTSRSPDTKSKSSKENTPQSSRGNSRSPARPGKRKASPSPTGSSSGRPARKNTLNQRLQQRRASEETGVVQSKHKRGSSSEVIENNSMEYSESSDSNSSPAKKATFQGQNSAHLSPDTQGIDGEGVEITEENRTDSNGKTVDLNDSEHVSVIKRHRSPETYQKYKLFKLTDWAKHAEKQNQEWDQVVTSAVEPNPDSMFVTENSMGDDNCQEGQKMQNETDNAEVNIEKNQKAQSGKGSLLPKTASPNKKSGSPRSSLWTGNVKPGSRDWSRVKQYGRRSKAPEKLCSIKRSRSEDDETLDERQKRRKSDNKKQPEELISTDNKVPIESNISCKSEVDLKTQPTKNNSLTPQSAQNPDLPRTSPCAVSIQRLNIQSGNDTSFNLSSSQSKILHVDLSTKRVNEPKFKQLSAGSESQAVLRELSTIANRATASNDPSNTTVCKTEGVMPINNSGSRTSSSASVSSDLPMLEPSQAGDGKKLTSPPRVTRSRERSESRGSSVSNSSHQDSPAKGKSKESASSQSMLKSKPKPVVIGDEVIGHPLGGRKQHCDSPQPRRSSRPSTSQYSVNPKSGEDTREERRNRKR